MVSSWARMIRRALFPRLQEVVSETFSVAPGDTIPFIMGTRNLGTGFYTPSAGFSEDTWPIIIVGEFVPEYNGDTALYDLRRFRRRLVLNPEENWGAVQVAFRRWPVERVAVSDMCKVLDRINAYVEDGYLTRSLNVKRTGRGRQELKVTIDAHDMLLKVFAARINFLWSHGRDSSQVDLPEWGHKERMRWRNPNRELIEELKGLRFKEV